jgi:hypothetical protein
MRKFHPKNIYISGDSFCSSRNLKAGDWPAVLAGKLSLTLYGKGYPGTSWWPVREELLEYKETDLFDQTDLFVFCHTDQERTLASKYTLSLGRPDEVDVGLLPTERDSEEMRIFKKIYLRRIQSTEISDWQQRQWFKELNEILAGKQVLHLASYDNAMKNFHLLDEMKFPEILLNISLKEEVRCVNQMHADTRPNHLNFANNLKLANELYKFININLVQETETQ